MKTKEFVRFANQEIELLEDEYPLIKDLPYHKKEKAVIQCLLMSLTREQFENTELKSLFKTIKQLLERRPITSLKGTPNEWIEQDGRIYNLRYPSLICVGDHVYDFNSVIFSHNGGRDWWHLDTSEAYRDRFMDSCYVKYFTDIIFPYRPPIAYQRVFIEYENDNYTFKDITDSPADIERLKNTEYIPYSLDSRKFPML